jgi:hypothetical protein
MIAANTICRTVAKLFDEPIGKAVEPSLIRALARRAGSSPGELFLVFARSEEPRGKTKQIVNHSFVDEWRQAVWGARCTAIHCWPLVSPAPVATTEFAASAIKSRLLGEANRWFSLRHIAR